MFKCKDANLFELCIPEAKHQSIKWIELDGSAAKKDKIFINVKVIASETEGVTPATNTNFEEFPKENYKN